MKTYVCSKCGNRFEIADGAEIQICDCGNMPHELDGIVRVGGVMAIWRDGREVWSGTGLEAVELLAKYLQPSYTLDARRAALAIDTIEGYGKFSPGMDGYAGIMAIRDYIKRTSSVVPSEQAAEADRIVRLVHECESMWLRGPQRQVAEYVAKYPKT